MARGAEADGAQFQAPLPSTLGAISYHSIMSTQLPPVRRVPFNQFGALLLPSVSCQGCLCCSKRELLPGVSVSVSVSLLLIVTCTYGYQHLWLPALMVYTSTYGYQHLWLSVRGCFKHHHLWPEGNPCAPWRAVASSKASKAVFEGSKVLPPGLPQPRTLSKGF